MNFPIGYYDFHQNEAINFQMNRRYSSGCLDYGTLMSIGKEISDFDCWTKTFLGIAEQFRNKGDYVASATCLRAAQFYTLGDECGAKGQLLKVVYTNNVWKNIKLLIKMPSYHMFVFNLKTVTFPSYINVTKKVAKET